MVRILALSWALALPALGAAAKALIVPQTPLSERFEQRNFAAPMRFTVETLDGVPALKVTGENAASGLYRPVELDVGAFPVLRWQWRAERLPAGVDLSTKAREDFALGLFVAFGDPGLFSDAKTLAYAWTRTPQAPGSVVRSPRYPDKLRTIVLRKRNAPLGKWVTETRHLVEDFRRAYGHAPQRPVAKIAFFSDNDQTGGALLGYYGPVRAVAAGGR